MKRNYHDNGLDFFRVLATVQVFLGHIITHFSLPQLWQPVYFIRGVPILFALCGFLAAKSLDQYSTKEFYIRRAVRILPGFWTCIAINSVIIMLIYAVTPTVMEGILYLVTQILGLNFYTGDWLRGYGVGVPNGVLWTIGVQIQFFLLSPIIYRLLHKLKLSKSLIMVACLTVISVGLKAISRYLPDIAEKLIQVTVIPYLYFLILGMTAWCFRDQIIPALEKVRWILLVVYVVWNIAENNLQFPHIFDGIMYNTVTTLIICMVVFAFAFTFRWRLKNDLTYGFYLYHMVFLNIIIHFGYKALHFDLQSLVILIIITGMTLLFAWISQRFVETPIANLIKKKPGV